MTFLAGVLAAATLCVAPSVQVGGQSVTLVLLEGQPYVRLADWAGAAGAQVVWPTEELKAEVSFAGHLLVLTPENTVVTLDGRARNMPYPVRWQGEELYLPRLLVEDVARLVPRREGAQILAIGVSVKTDTTLVRIQTDRPAGYDADFENGTDYRLRLNASCPALRVEARGIVKRAELVRGAQTEIVFAFRAPAEARLMPYGQGLLCKFSPRTTSRLKLVVVDAGHGGMDAGAIGPSGVKEKDMNLDIALRLADLLRQELGVKVTMTRSTDEFIPLGGRTAIANRNRADLLVSIHCNAAPRNSKARGLETYFLSDARTTWSRAVAARENASIRFEMPDTALANLDEVSLILHDLAQNEFLRESSELAEAVHEGLLVQLAIPDRSVQQAGFFVLRGAFMPAILVESAFISCPAEEKLLCRPEFRARVARGTCEGIKVFARECFAKR